MASYAARPGSAPDVAGTADETAGEEDAPDVDLPSLETRIGWYNDWEEATRTYRKLACRDRAYYDNEQWTKEELDDLEERGQLPSTNNRIARKINTVLGDEIEKRVDPIARPRQPAHRESARTMTDALRYVVDAQGADSVRSAVAKNVAIEGYGGAVLGIDDDGCITATHVEWNRLGADHHSRALDFSDAKFRFIIIWQDLEDAIAEHPHAEDELRAAVANVIGVTVGDSTEDTPKTWVVNDRKRPRVKICEMYVPIGDDHWRFCFTQGADIDEPARTWILDEKKRCSVCPLIMVRAFVDQDGFSYGLVRPLISRQDQINHSTTKAIHLISVRQVVAEQNVIGQPDKFMRALSMPDGFAEVQAGALQEQRVIIRDGQQLAQSHIEFMQQAIADIDGIGPTASNLPDLPRDASGRAQQIRAKAAGKEQQHFFDVLDDWTMELYRLDWLAIRWNWNDEKWMRVTDDEDLEGYRFVSINRRTTRAQRFTELVQRQPPLQPRQALEIAAGVYAPQIWSAAQWALSQATHGQQLPPEAAQHYLVSLIAQDVRMQEQITVDQVDQIDVDIVLDEAPDNAVIEQEEFAQWVTLVPSLVQGGLDPREAAKMTVQLSSFRDAKKVLEMLDKPPPQATQQQAQAQAIQQLQQQMAQLQAQLVAAEVQKTQADARLSDARAQEIMSGAAQAGQPEPVKPHEAIAAQREQLGAQLDTAKAQAQIEKDKALTQKHQVDTQINVAKAQHALVTPRGIPQ